jgi:hypothetical protein
MSRPAGMSRAAAAVPAAVVGTTRPLGLAFWVAVVAAVLALELVARLTGGGLPTLGQLVARYLPTPVLRAAAVAVWLYAGWHLFAH